MHADATSLKSTPTFEALLGHGAHYAGATLVKKDLLTMAVVADSTLLNCVVVLLVTTLAVVCTVDSLPWP